MSSGQQLMFPQEQFNMAEIRNRVKSRRTKLPSIIGIPPEYSDTLRRNQFGSTVSEDAPNMNDVIRDCFPILEITPAMPEFRASLEMFRLKNAMGELSENELVSEILEGFRFGDTNKASFVKDLYNYGFTLPEGAKSLKFAIQGNSFPVMESFSNEVGESIFQNVTNTFSAVARDFTFMTGVETAGEAVDKLGSVVDKMFGEEIGKGAASGLKGFTEGAADWIEDKTGISQDTQKQVGSVLAQTLAGRAIDFPQVWRSSSWTPSYTANIRLYNPFPGDEESTKKFVIGPLAALLMFVVPRTNNGYNFAWPYLCKYRVPGLYNIQSGFIKDVTVIRGGDDNHFGLNSIPGIVDLRISLGTLYSNMIGGDPLTTGDRGNPKLHQWLGEMAEGQLQDTGNLAQHGPKKWSNGQEGYSDPETQDMTNSGPDWKQTGYPEGFVDRAITAASQAAAIASVVPGATQQVDEKFQNRDEVPDRVSDYAKTQYEALKDMGN